MRRGSLERVERHQLGCLGGHWGTGGKCRRSSDPPVKNNGGLSGGLLDVERRLKKQTNKPGNRGVTKLDQERGKERNKLPDDTAHAYVNHVAYIRRTCCRPSRTEQCIGMSKNDLLALV
jgi:hypothetical protein